MNERLLTAILLAALLLSACAAPKMTGEPAPAEPEESHATEPTRPPESTTDPAETGAPTGPKEESMPFELTSSAFKQGEPIPIQYSCDGEDISPPLAWSDPPEGTQSLTLIMDDPDAPAGTWDHWILFNIPADIRKLTEDAQIEGKNQDPDTIFVGGNSWGRSNYGGPCPPGGTHRYFFKLYAVDTTISLLPGASKRELLSAMEGHILAETELMGTYTR